MSKIKRPQNGINNHRTPYSMFKDGFFNTKKIPKGFNFAYGASIVHVDSCHRIDIDVKICDKRNEFYAE